MFKGVDLASDTATKPSIAMKEAMFAAELGDEQKAEDPTTLQLEAMAAELLGFDRALFFPSAAMANQIAICLLCERGDELIAAENSHIFTAEVGGPAIHAGVMAHPIATATGIFTGDDVHAAYRWRKGPHHPVTKCVAVENTTNFGGGLAWDLASLDSVLKAVKELGLKAHLDGARLFNAAVKSEVDPKRLTAGFDTVTICLSKGLGCPTGAVLAFADRYHEKARRLKHLFGGAMRQSGILAAAGIYALKHNINRLAEDHHHTELFTNRLIAEVPAIAVETHPAATNMVFFKWLGQHLSPDQFHAACLAKGFRFSRIEENRFRAVFHLDISKADLDFVMTQLKEMAELGA